MLCGYAVGFGSDLIYYSVPYVRDERSLVAGWFCAGLTWQPTVTFTGSLPTDLRWILPLPELQHYRITCPTLCSPLATHYARPPLTPVEGKLVTAVHELDLLTVLKALFTRLFILPVGS